MTNPPLHIPSSLQEVPPKWAHFCLHIEKFIQDELGVDIAGKTIVTAFSGGVDSTALLLVMHYLSRKNGGRVIAAHLNHKLRLEADDDARWVQLVCDRLAIAHFIRSVDVHAMSLDSGVGLEEAGRDARYAFFKDVREEAGADVIALGHHLGDLTEDVLMRLIRGTGWPGLAGMSGVDAGRKLMRPFLLTPKSQLIDFLTDIGLPWREDLTNADPAWTRNRVRHDILPLLLKENPSFSDSLARLWKVGQIDQDYWAETTKNVAETLPSELLNQSHKAVRLRLYKAALAGIEGGQSLADTLFKLDKAWQESRIGSTFQFPGKKTATITASGVVFCAKD